VVAAVLHLGNVQFSEAGHVSSVVDDAPLHTIAQVSRVRGQSASVATCNNLPALCSSMPLPVVAKRFLADSRYLERTACQCSVVSYRCCQRRSGELAATVSPTSRLRSCL